MTKLFHKELILSMFLAIALCQFAQGRAVQGLGQTGSGRLVGQVMLQPGNRPVHGVEVLIVELGIETHSDDDGRYEFAQVPSGTYELVAHMHGLTSAMQTARIEAGTTATVNFQLSVLSLSDEVTVTASGQEQTLFDAFQAVTTLDSFRLAQQMAPSIGETLQNAPGVSKRSFGPGTARPVIRGFDGDRVLVLEDGIRTGSLASQSGDHGEPINPLALERLEVVKGPATLLYGSNALGGVVNAVSRHHQLHEHPHEGIRGYVSGLGGSNNGHGGGSAGFEYGVGNWLIWGSGGGQRTGDYETPLGEIENSRTRVADASFGAGWYGDRVFASAGYRLQDGRYGVPSAVELLLEEEGEEGPEEEHHHGPIDLAFRRHNLRFTTGIRELGDLFDNFRVSLDVTDWNHEELEGGEPATRFANDQFVYRGVFEQRKKGILSGRFGIWGLIRDYDVTGEEALAPPVDQSNFALFALEELGFEHFRLQFGGRLEHTGYEPMGMQTRSFTGFSGAAGVHVPLWTEGAFVLNFTRSYRAPALEELYNQGPHLGLLAFELGDANLERELSHGFDFSLRHSGSRVRAEANFFRYDIDQFVFLAPTGQIREGLIEAQYAQADSRYMGTEVTLRFGLHPSLWLNLGMDAVDAELKQSDTPLPRIPPLRGRIGLQVEYESFTLEPELILAGEQEEIFPTETHTAGYGLANLAASYTLTQQHLIHRFSVNFFNLGDRLYRNHVSFIKEVAPEIGRGVRFTYTMRFF